MALPGEIGHDGRAVCCGEVLELKVLRSAAGYYLGTFCNECGPYSRESSYFGTRAEAEKALKDEDEPWRR